MSDLFVHWAVFDDCRRLAVHDDRIDPFLSELLNAHAEHARLGALSRSGRKVVPRILASAREKKGEAGESTRFQQKIAFALGAVTHYAADVVMKPLMRRLSKAGWDMAHPEKQDGDTIKPAKTGAMSVREISAYYDTHVFRKVYLDGKEGIFGSFVLGRNTTEPGRVLEDFIRSLFQRSLLLCHTISLDTDDPFTWLDRLFDLYQPLYLDIEQYASVYASPDPRKIAIYEVETAFYRENDPIVKCARTVQNGGALSALQIGSALADDVNQGAYGQALALGMRRLRETTSYWIGSTDTGPDLQQ
jgi:hypothetical protein